MNLLERFLLGDISIICRTKGDFEKMKLVLCDEENIRVISSASRRCKSVGAEFAFPKTNKYELEITQSLIRYNPADSPLSQYRSYQYTETMEFPEFWDILNLCPVPNFDAGLFYDMLGIDTNEVRQ